jgi:DNA-binding LacI/PurR family transcriptional regulator
VIVSRNLVGSRLISYLVGTGLPFVLVGTADHHDVVQIDHDHRTACRELTSLLAQRWGGTAGLIAGARSHLVSRARAKGFTDAAPDAPIVWSAIDEQSVIAAFHHLRSQGVDLFFCEDDMICQYLETNLQAGRLGVNPANVHVASFYDSPLLTAVSPTVPVLHFDSVNLGAKACQMLLARIDGQDVDNVLLEYEIVMGGCDAPLGDTATPPLSGHMPQK